MVEAGADQVPEATLLEALDLAQREIVKLCEAQEELRAKAGKPKWLDADVTEELERAATASEIAARIQPSTACTRAAPSSSEIVEREVGALTMESTEADIVRELQTRMSLAQMLEKQRSAAVEAPSASSSRTTCARSPRPSRTRRS